MGCVGRWVGGLVVVEVVGVGRGGIKGEWKGLGRVLRGCGRRWKGVGVDRRGVVLLAPLIAFSSPR